jgi:electron transport complex protein RnfG
MAAIVWMGLSWWKTGKPSIVGAATGAVAGLAIVFVFQWTAPTIEAYRAEQLRLAIHEVLAQPDRFDTLYVVDGALTATPPADAATAERVFLGYRADRPVGFAIEAGEPGFQDIIGLIFGYDHTEGALLGMKVLASKETPGLGDKIEKDSSFVAQFQGVEPPLLGVKARDATDDPHEIDMITGATISSRTIIKAINNALDRFGPMIDAYAAAHR